MNVISIDIDLLFKSILTRRNLDSLKNGYILPIELEFCLATSNYSCT